MSSSGARDRTRGTHPPLEAYTINNPQRPSPAENTAAGERHHRRIYANLLGGKLLGGKPLVVNLLVRAILAHGQKRVVDLLAQRIARLEHDAVVLLAERQADHVNTALAFIRRVVKQDRRIEHDGFSLFVHARLIGILDKRHFNYLSEQCAQIDSSTSDER